MSRYLLIESRDPFDSPDTSFVHDLSRTWCRAAMT
jgi:hypothetical protein